MTQKNAGHGLRNAAGPLARIAGGALAGLLAAAVALGIAQLVAALTGPQGVPVTAVGSAAIDLTPVPVKDFAIAHFGTSDKLVLLSGIMTVLALFAAGTGVLALRRRVYGLAGLAVFGFIGVAAVLSRPVARPVDTAPTLAGLAVAAAALMLLVSAARAESRGAAQAARTRVTEARVTEAQATEAQATEAQATEAQATEARATSTPPPAGPAQPGRAPGRRRFLVTAAGTAVVAAAGAGFGELLLRRFSVSSARAKVALPAPAVSGPLARAAAQLPVPGVSRFITPNASFYRVDTALVLPQIAPDQWRLRVHGMVARELDLSFADLLKRPLTEADITLACVSNQVGGSYAGNARWLGASLAALLREAGPRRGADQILSTSADGWTCGTPLETVLDGRNALLAVGMNGQPLPVTHGFPVRMLVPGLYGYTSATKWVVDLEVTTFAASKSYWVQRGYAVQGPIKTMSRIDVPKPLQQVAAGRTAVAGVALAPHRGISRVQVRADGGAWRDAKLAEVPGIDTWRQWVWQWAATPGLHQLEVRATDGTGATEPARRTPIFPDGATGWDSVAVTVS
jgi:DMSO/TMAO reductase YedYZ molybdopterin-dependent catalytic subunit